MGPEDIQYYHATHADAPYDLERKHSHGGGPFLTAMGSSSAGEPFQMLDDAHDVKTESLRLFVRLTLAEVHDRGPDEGEEETDESSGAGAVAGYTAPLGVTPKVPGAKKKRQPAWSVVARAFGNAKRV